MDCGTTHRAWSSSDPQAGRGNAVRERVPTLFGGGGTGKVQDNMNHRPVDPASRAPCQGYGDGEGGSTRDMAFLAPAMISDRGGCSLAASFLSMRRGREGGFFTGASWLPFSWMTP